MVLSGQLCLTRVVARRETMENPIEGSKVQHFYTLHEVEILLFSGKGTGQTGQELPIVRQCNGY